MEGGRSPEPDLPVHHGLIGRDHVGRGPDGAGPWEPSWIVIRHCSASTLLKRRAFVDQWLQPSSARTRISSSLWFRSG